MIKRSSTYTDIRPVHSFSPVFWFTSSNLQTLSSGVRTKCPSTSSPSQSLRQVIVGSVSSQRHQSRGELVKPYTAFWMIRHLQGRPSLRNTVGTSIAVIFVSSRFGALRKATLMSVPQIDHPFSPARRTDVLELEFDCHWHHQHSVHRT